MQGRAFLDAAQILLAAGAGEAIWRAVAGRAYYALMLECREALFRWSYSLPPRENVHTFVRMRFSFAQDSDLKAIGQFLDHLGQMRNRADYNLSALSEFASATKTQQAWQDVTAAIASLDAIDGDPARQATAVAAIKAAFPP
jgi:hypothetical protein